MRVIFMVPLPLMAIAIGCSRSTLDVAGVVGQDSGIALEGTPTGGDGAVAGDDTSGVGGADASSVRGSDGSLSASDAHAMGDDAGAFGRQESNASEVGSDADDGDVLASDGPPALPCLDRPTVDCGCSSDVCSSSVGLGYAIERQVTPGCHLACLYNYFTFDTNGCVTGYRHDSDPGWPPDDACILQALGDVRFSCATGLSQPVSVYWSCTLAQ